MRVISGTVKGRKLKPVPGDTTRPITDRTKESLFNILGDWVTDIHVLDLFGGTGAVGIEALSRGAAHITFIDKSVAAIRTIQENLRLTGLSGQATLRKNDAFKILSQPPPNTGPFDLIYVAPPQYKDMWAKAVELLDNQLKTWLLPDGAVIAQIHPREYRDLTLHNLILYDKRQYGSTLLCFYEKNIEKSEAVDG